MKKTVSQKKKWLLGLAKILSLTTVAFAFQACYGVPNKEFPEKKINGVVKNKAGQPIPGIKVTVNEYLSAVTRNDGKFVLFTEETEEYTIKFSGNNQYIGRDTVITNDERYISFDFVLKIKNPLKTTNKC